MKLSADHLSPGVAAILTAEAAMLNPFDMALRQPSRSLSAVA